MKRCSFSVRPRGCAGLSGLTACPARLTEDPVAYLEVCGWDSPADSRAAHFPLSAGLNWMRVSWANAARGVAGAEAEPCSGSTSSRHKPTHDARALIHPEIHLFETGKHVLVSGNGGDLDDDRASQVQP